MHETSSNCNPRAAIQIGEQVSHPDLPVVICDFSVMAGFADMLKQLGQILYLAQHIGAHYVKESMGLTSYRAGDELLRAIDFHLFFERISRKGRTLLKSTPNHQIHEVDLDLNNNSIALASFTDLISYCKHRVVTASTIRSKECKVIKVNIRVEKYGILNPPYANWSNYFKLLLHEEYVSRTPWLINKCRVPLITAHYRLGDTTHFNVGEGLFISSWGALGANNKPFFTDSPSQSMYPHIPFSALKATIDATIKRNNSNAQLTFITDGYDKGIERITSRLENIDIPESHAQVDLKHAITSFAARQRKHIIALLGRYPKDGVTTRILWGETAINFKKAIQAIASCDYLIISGGGFAKWSHFFLNSKAHSVILTPQNE